MFGFKKKNEEKEIFAALNGEICKIEDVPDEVFSQKMLGDGAAIIPTDGEVVSPVKGTVSQVTDTLHAYCITSEDDLDILIHVGVDTVELKGEGFEVFVKEGDKVSVGDRIAKADLEFIKSKGFKTHTPILITNMDAVSEISAKEGSASAGETPVISYKLSK